MAVVRKPTQSHLKWPFPMHQMEEKVTNKCMVSCCLKAAQIIIALVQCALGILCFRLFVEEEKISNTGLIPVPVTLVYAFSTVPFFITSGSTSVGAQRKATRCKFVAAIAMNIISACFATVGVITLTIACLTYESENDYVWSHIAGSMLLQFLLFIAISELIIAGLLVTWTVKALHRADYNEEGFSRSESSSNTS